MKKRMSVLALCLILAFSLAVPAAATSSTAGKVQHDKQTMAFANMPTEGLKVSSLNKDGTITYSCQLTEDVTDYITLYYKDDGSVDVDVREGDFHDVLTIQKNGTVLLDGKAPHAIYDGETPADENGIMPMAGSTYIYSNTPFPGTAGKYTGTASNHDRYSVTLEKAIRYMTGWAIGFWIGYYLCPGEANQVAEVCAEVGLRLRGIVEETADNSSALSYRVKSKGVPGNNTFLSYRQFAGTYYAKAGYSGKGVYKVFYEKRESLT